MRGHQGTMELVGLGDLNMLDDTTKLLAKAHQTETIAPDTVGNVPPPAAPSGTEAPGESAGSSGATAQGASRKRWYAIQHHPYLGGYARLSIRRLGFRVHWPREIIRERRRDDTLVPLFRSYLFVEFDRDKPWSEILRAGGVVTILGIREFGAPAPARRGSVERLIRWAGGEDDGLIDATEDAKATFRTNDVLHAGEEVAFLDNALFGHGAIVGIDRGRANIEVMMQLFGMECRAQVHRSRVRAKAA